MRAVNNPLFFSILYYMCAKYNNFAHYPCILNQHGSLPYIAAPYDGAKPRWNCVLCRETKAFCISTTRQVALAFVYNRSFIKHIRNCKRRDFTPLIGYARVSTEDQPPLPHYRRWTRLVARACATATTGGRTSRIKSAIQVNLANLPRYGVITRHVSPPDPSDRSIRP